MPNDNLDAFRRFLKQLNVDLDGDAESDDGTEEIDWNEIRRFSPQGERSEIARTLDKLAEELNTTFDHDKPARKLVGDDPQLLAYMATYASQEFARRYGMTASQWYAILTALIAYTWLLRDSYYDPYNEDFGDFNDF